MAGRQRTVTIVLVGALIAAGTIWGPGIWRLGFYRALERYEVPEGGGVIEFRWPRGDDSALVMHQRSHGEFEGFAGPPPLAYHFAHEGRTYFFLFPGTEEEPAFVTTGGDPPRTEVERLLASRKKVFPGLDWDHLTLGSGQTPEEGPTD